MYSYFVRERDRLFDVNSAGRDPALDHSGNYRRVLQTHLRHATAVAAGHRLPPAAGYLFKRLTDTRALRHALEELTADGPKSPGKDDVRLTDLDDQARWGMSRRLHADLRSGSYCPGPLLIRPVPKDGNPDQTRPITLLCARDAVVAKSLAMFIGPVVDPHFSGYSFGYRKDRSPWHALATAVAIAEQTDRWTWVSADMKQAFDRIPREPALDACSRLLPEDVVTLIRLISFGDLKRGTPQGSAFSPLLFNVFADRHVDRPMARRYPDRPLLRYADDLLIQAADVTEAQELFASLATQTRSAGVALKESVDEAVVDVKAGQSLRWLGYWIYRNGRGGVTVRVHRRAWERLGHELDDCHFHDQSPLRAVMVVRSWLNYLAPCFDHEDRRAVLRDVRAAAADRAFDELPYVDDLLQVWSAAHARWSRLSDAVFAAVARSTTQTSCETVAAGR